MSDGQQTREFIDLLTVLDRLTRLEPDQAELQTSILTGTLVTRDELRAAGTQWPQAKKDTAPRMPVIATAGQLSIGP